MSFQAFNAVFSFFDNRFYKQAPDELVKASAFAYFQYGGLSQALAFLGESAGRFCHLFW